MHNITVQHIAVLRILMQFSISRPSTLHNLFFLASAQALEKHEIGFYDFIKTSHGAFSSTLHSILEQMVQEKAIKGQGLEIEPLGRELYYNLAGSLIGFQDYTERCNQIITCAGHQSEQINTLINSYLLYRRTKIGSYLFP